ncbi:MAG: hypothetical protein AB1508_19040 [Pseudomonadota bacterium]
MTAVKAEIGVPGAERYTPEVIARCCPYAALVPREWDANLRFRRRMVRLGADRRVGRRLWEMCRQDVLLYVNTFVWTYDPRTVENTPRTLPMITYPFQEAALLAVKDALGRHDLLIEKSRDMTATWMCLVVLEHAWHFEENVRFGLCSRNEDYVDGNPKSLLWKIDFIHKHQPRWLLPAGRWLGRDDPRRTRLHLDNADTGSTLDGEATTADVGRGDRFTAMLMDEFAAFGTREGYAALRATRDSTPCRIINSTAQGVTGAFYGLTRTAIPRLRLHWSLHPRKRIGLYSYHEGQLRVLDESYWTPARLAAYDFAGQRWSGDPDFAVRSPWFDRETWRCENKTEVLQELEIRYDAASSPFFNVNQLESHAREFATPPLHRGELDFDTETTTPTEFVERPGGPLSLWFRIGTGGRPDSTQDYVIGADIATGSRMDGRGASNSVLTVGSKTTREMVAQLTIAGISPTDFAQMALALARWFAGPNGPAFLIWESNGPGGSFGDRIIESGYRSVYYRTNETVILKRPSRQPGWYSTRDTKRMLLTEFARAIGPAREFVVRSRETLDECTCYEYGSGGAITHSAAVTTEDPSGARENHGDRVIASALCWWAMRGPVHREKQTATTPIGSSLASRREARIRKAAEESYW